VAYNGYADHFLHDSFASGHLINKTLVMQSFVEWAATTDLFVEDWQTLKHFNPLEQPALAGWPLYNTSYTGPVTDPQTVEELGGDYQYPERVALSGVQPYSVEKELVDKDAAYRNYWTFLSSTIAQAAANGLHDVLNERSVWAT